MKNLKLKEAFRLFYPAAQFKGMVDADFERFEDLLELNNLVLIEKSEAPKNVKFQSLNVLYAQVKQIGCQYINDFEQNYRVKIVGEIDSYNKDTEVRIDIYHKDSYKSIFTGKGKFAKSIIAGLEDSIKMYVSNQNLETGFDAIEEKEVGDGE